MKENRPGLLALRGEVIAAARHVHPALLDACVRSGDNADSAVSTEPAESARTEWRIRYENDSPHRERTNADLVSAADVPGRFRHNLRVPSRSMVEEFRVLAEREGATGVQIDWRTTRQVVGEWREAEALDA